MYWERRWWRRFGCHNIGGSSGPKKNGNFEDGNGRVARCLILLVLLRNDFAPLVVDRRERGRYLQYLDRAVRAGFNAAVIENEPELANLKTGGSFEKILKERPEETSR